MPIWGTLRGTDSKWGFDTPKRRIMLTDVQLKAKPEEKEYKLRDGGGLYLLVSTTGTGPGG